MRKRIIIVLFIIYLSILLYLTLFRNYLGRNVGIYDINLIPFKNIYIIISDFFKNVVTFRFMVRNIFGNLIAFMPFAYFLFVLFGIKTNKLYALILFVIIFAIEFLQYILRIGFFDIDDIILNLLGSFSFFLFIKSYFLKCKKSCFKL